MIEYIPIDLRVHKSLLIDLNDEYLSRIAEEVMKHYKIDVVSLLGQPIRDYAKNSVEKLTSYVPPEGVFYILKIKKNLVGMGAVRKLNVNTGVIKRMYIRPNYRGKGFGKALLRHLLNKGKEFGCSRILLDTGLFMTAAQHVYRSAGFQEREIYPGTEVPPGLQSYWIYMESKSIN